METIDICGRVLPVVAQKHARLRHRIKDGDLQKVLSKEYSHESYRVLSVLIPAIPLGVRDPDNPEVYTIKPIPEWEWDGYPTEELWEQAKSGEDVYDEDADPSPTTLEIVLAFEKAIMANGAQRMGKLLSLVQSGATLVAAQQTGNSHESPGSNGVSRSQPTGISVPT